MSVKDQIVRINENVNGSVIGIVKGIEKENDRIETEIVNSGIETKIGNDPTGVLKSVGMRRNRDLWDRRPHKHHNNILECRHLQWQWVR